MSTQQAGGLPFSIVPEEHREHFRLLELPPELLALLTKDNPESLELKSAEGPPGNALGGTAVLCSGDKTYNVRQVNTSNSVYVARPRVADGDGSNLQAPETSLEAFAQCGSFLEVTPQARQSAVSYIKAALPTYSSTGHFGGKALMSKDELFASIPLSRGECGEAWAELACFESSDPSGSFIPSAAMRVQVWKSLLSGAIADGIDLSGAIVEAYVEAMIDQNEEWPPELPRAVLKSISTSNDPDEAILIDETKCTRFVGASLLESYGAKGCAVRAFKEAWADLLPEKWRGGKGPELDVLNGVYKQEGSNVSFVSDGASGGTGVEIKSTIGAKRGWHEKFRQSKKSA